MYKKISPKNKDNKNTEKMISEIQEIKLDDSFNSYLGNKGYSIYKNSLNPKLIEFIKKELTVKPYIQGSIVQPPGFPVYQESENKIYIPRCYGIKTFGEPKVNKLNPGLDINIKFEGTLRETQKPIVDAYLSTINNSGGAGLIELETGGGKTVLGLKIIELIKKKTIIFVHKTFLKNQWKERINHFLPDAKIGSIQGQVIDIENKDIVIAMIQSISMKSYPDSLFEEFGLSVYDEVHHLSSEVFSNCLKKCNTYKCLGLSATMNRKDGLTFVFKMYLGEICNTLTTTKNKNNVLVKAIDHIIDDDEYNEIEYDFRGNIKYSTMINKLVNCDFRSDFIYQVILNELKLNNNQQIILLSHTKNLLNYLFKKFDNNENISVGYYVGGMKERDLKISESKQVLLATYSMAAEGLDIPSLTTLILATPKSDIVQSVGRILRTEHSQPLIIDIVDQHEVFIKQFAKRKSLYNERTYKVIRTNNDDYHKYNLELTKTGYNEELLNKYWKELIYKPRSKNKTKVDAKCLIGSGECIINLE